MGLWLNRTFPLVMCSTKAASTACSKSWMEGGSNVKTPDHDIRWKEQND